jgi:hypothetical protein
MSTSFRAALIGVRTFIDVFPHGVFARRPVAMIVAIPVVGGSTVNLTELDASVTFQTTVVV